MSHWSPDSGPLNFATLRILYRTRRLTPRDLVSTLFRRIRACPHSSIWITLFDEEEVLARALALEQLPGSSAAALPLFGIPFAVKDNIDVAGKPTTAGCPQFAYVPTRSAACVEKLLNAGAILIGKTNLDQFASGLTGMLSPYGEPSNSFDGDYVSGGSSSGSALAVAVNLVSFAVGTDTAGSGRVPAAFNNLVGAKPTRGLVSTVGIVPACQSLDCAAYFALNTEDAAELITLTGGLQSADPWSRSEAADFDINVLRFPVGSFRFGVPLAHQRKFFGDTHAANLYEQSIARLESLGGTRIDIDFSAFQEAGTLLYDGPWIAERLTPLREFRRQHPEALHPVTKSVLSRGDEISGVDVFSGLHRLRELAQRTHAQWALMDLLVLPTAPTIPRRDAVRSDPRAASARLGIYTNFVNLLDLSALAVPAGFLPNGLPFGVTLMAPAFHDAQLFAIGLRFAPQRVGGVLGKVAPDLPDEEPDPLLLAPPTGRTLLCVVGAHLSGQPLNHQLTELGALLVRSGRTAPLYRLYALSGTTPAKPALSRAAPGFAGHPIEIEVWSIPDSNLAAFLALVPTPMCIGNIVLDNGESVKGFLCESCALVNAKDISSYGGWRNYIKRSHEIGNRG